MADIVGAGRLCRRPGRVLGPPADNAPLTLPTKRMNSLVLISPSRLVGQRQPIAKNTVRGLIYCTGEVRTISA